MTSALAVRGLAKRYGAVEALRGVDLAVEPGELVGLLGPNGAGKSTLVKIAVGLVRQSAGTAEVAGAPAGSLAARRSLGYLAELFRFPGWHSAEEVLLLHQRLAGSDGGERDRSRRPPVPRRHARGRAPSRRGARRRADLRRPRPHLHARGRLPRGGRRRDVVNVVTIVRYGLQEAVRRRVFAVVIVLTVGFL